MATSNITHNITDSGATGKINGIRIIARLRPVPGFRVSDASEVFPEETTTTDASGDYTIALERQSNITPSGTYWEVEERLSTGSVMWNISVGDSNATLFASLISVLPTLSASDFLTQETGDSRYVLVENASSGLTVATAGRATNFSLTGGAWAIIPHDVTDQEDVAGMHDPSTNNERLVVPSGVNRAKVRLFTLLATDLSSGHNIQLKIGYNEAVADPTAPVAYVASLNAFRTPVIAESRWLTVSPGDFFTGSARCSQTRDLLYTAGGLSRSYFEIECRKV